MNIEHKLKPIEHWIVDGKAYRLATEGDVGKECYRSDTSFDIAIKNNTLPLEAVNPTEAKPYAFGFDWKYAYVQDDSLLADNAEIEPGTTEEPLAKPIDWTKPVRTKDGRAVRVLCTDGPGDYPVIGIVDDTPVPQTWTLDGCFWAKEFSECYLENAPQRIKKTLWMNIFNDGSFDLFGAKEDADADRGDRVFACVKIAIDCEEGEGL